MNYLLIADAYEPATISAAQQLRDFVITLSRREHCAVWVLIPDSSTSALPMVEVSGKVTLIRARAFKTKDVNFFRRFFAELLLPLFLYRGFRKSAAAPPEMHGIIWYSPTIFLGPIVSRLKRQYRCRSYLILRDLFPDWALDTGVMRKGLAYWILKRIESYQYHQADVIGVQTPANLPHLLPWKTDARGIEVLPNWLAPLNIKPCSLRISETPLAGRRVFVYAGNMGVAQDMGPIIDMAASLRSDTGWGFLLVGRGSETGSIRRRIALEGLDNVFLSDEIEPEAIPGLFEQCQVGIVALDPRHTTHNIPGKFIAYMRSGLPVLARVNKGNDLLTLINAEHVGAAVDDASAEALKAAAESLMSLPDRELTACSDNARVLWQTHYSAEACVEQVLAGLNRKI